jgi:MFS transporter, DHA3 family, macrolide efflux protein
VRTVESERGGAPFRVFLAGQATSYFGDHLYLFGIVWWALLTTGDVSAATTVVLVAALAAAVAAPVAGRLIDQGDKLRLLVRVNAAYAVLTATSGVLMVTGRLSWWLLLGFAFAVAAADQLSVPACAALLPGLVGKDELRVANGSIETWRALTGIAAPAVAGLVAHRAPQVGWLLIADAATFIVNGACLASVRRVVAATPGPATAPTIVSAARGLRGQFGAVWSVLARDRALLDILLVTTAVNLLIAPLGVLVPAALQRSGSAAAGLAMSAFAAGVLAVARCVPRLGNVADEVLLVVGVGGLAVGDLVFGLAPVLGLACVGSFLSGAGTVLVVIAARTWFQRNTPAELHGRLFSLRFALGTLVRPIGLAAGGAIAVSRGAAHTVAGIGAVLAILAVAVAAGAWSHRPRPVAQPAGLANPADPAGAAGAAGWTGRLAAAVRPRSRSG